MTYDFATSRAELTKAQREAIEAWCVKLESGQYKQAHEALCGESPSGDRGFCCLGLAMDGNELGSWEDGNAPIFTEGQAHKQFFFRTTSNALYAGYPPYEILRELFGAAAVIRTRTSDEVMGDVPVPYTKEMDQFCGWRGMVDQQTIKDQGYVFLSDLNDSGFSFKEIARQIRATYLSEVLESEA